MFNDRSDTLTLLHSRRSGKARDMRAPGPDAAQIQLVLQAAARVPDHGKLAPWRFIEITPDRREAFASVIETAYRAEKPEASQTEINAVRAYATDAPTLIVVLSTPKIESHIPLWEQQLSVGAVIQNMLIATHGLGFVANWLTGWPAYAEGVRSALGCKTSDMIAGFIYIGTNSKPLDERPRPDLAALLSKY